MVTAIGLVTCNFCGHPLDPETFRCDCRDDEPNDPSSDDYRDAADRFDLALYGEVQAY